MRLAAFTAAVWLIAAAASCTCDESWQNLQPAEQQAEPVEQARAADSPEVGGPAPSAVLIAFWDAILAVNDSRVLDLVHVDSPVWNREKFQDSLYREARWDRFREKIENRGSRMTIVNESIGGGEAFVTAEFASTLPGYEPRTQEFEFRTQGDRWRLWLPNSRIVMTPRRVSPEKKTRVINPLIDSRIKIRPPMDEE